MSEPAAAAESINDVPIADALEGVRVTFRSLCRGLGVSTADQPIDQLPSTQLQQLATSFLTTLAIGLPPASDLGASLRALSSSITSDDRVLNRIKPLVEAALAERPDTALLWNLALGATINVEESTPPQTAETSLQTPPQATPLANNNTPITYSSSSQQDSEQARKLLEDKALEEIRTCTYRDAEGFFEKYFEGKDWTGRAQDVYESIKADYVDDRWAKLDESPDQTQVLNWLFSLQDNLLSNEKRRYCTVELPINLTGGETQRQIDLLIKPKSGESSDTEHDWRNIMVIGELKASDKDGIKKPLVQLAVHARDLFTSQPTRRCLHAFTICGDKMETWVFDRSGCYSPGPFDIHEHPERFIRVLAGYIMMSEEELGLDTFIQRDGDSRFINLEKDGGKMERLQLLPDPLTRQRAIASRATSCFHAKLPGSHEYDHVAKFSWPPSKQKPESEFLELANQRGVEGIAKLIGHYDITSTNALRSDVKLTKRYSFNGTTGVSQLMVEAASQSQILVNKHHSIIAGSYATRSLKRKSGGENPNPKRFKTNSKRSGLQNEITYLAGESRETNPAPPGDDLYDNRIFRCLVIFPMGRPIYKFKSPIELLIALRDAIKAHQSLYSKGNILHRDISENNIIITDQKKAGFSGMLIDLDLAKELGSGSSGARCRTGTMEFMAIEVLRDVDHTYRHDLESFLYVLLWQCIRRAWERKQNLKPRSQLTGWYTGSFDDMARNKQGNMDKFAFEYVLKEFPEDLHCVKPLCRELRSILFPIKDEALFTGTLPDPSDVYEPMVDAFNKNIGRMTT